MKKEEACRRIDNLDFYLRHYTSPDYGESDHEAMMMAKKALEQEPVIDKIRAEIEAEMEYHSGTGDEVVQAYADGLHNAIRIIDKYKAESEGQAN